MNILSLFDGISCGRVALDRAWILIWKYFSSEIDKYAIQIAKKNYQDTIHIGDVRCITYRKRSIQWVEIEWTWRLFNNSGYWQSREYNVNIDLLIGGSPCQDLSIAKKNWKWLQWEKSSLFFEYVRILKEVKPKYFLLENVASMKKADKEEITRVLTEVYPDVQCYLINSALVSAQNRKRLYWTNIQWVEQPYDKNIVLNNVLEEIIDEKYYINNTRTNTIFSNIRSRIVRKDEKCPTILANEYKQSTDSIALIENENCFYEINSVWKLRQWYEYFKTQWKTYSINVSHAWNTKIFTENCIRRLTPIECERLQTLPDNYTEWVSNTQRYKAIGNWWTVDVIAHIFSYLK